MIYKHQTNHGTAARAVAGVCRFPDSATRKVRTNNRLQFLGVLCVSVAILTGCSITTGKRTPDGTLTVTNWRALWTSEAVDFTTKSGDFTARLKIGKSATDDEAVAAVVEGVVKGVTRP